MHLRVTKNVQNPFNINSRIDLEPIIDLLCSWLAGVAANNNRNNVLAIKTNRSELRFCPKLANRSFSNKLMPRNEIDSNATPNIILEFGAFYQFKVFRNGTRNLVIVTQLEVLCCPKIRNFHNHHLAFKQLA